MGANPDYGPGARDEWIDRGDPTARRPDSPATRVIVLAVVVLMATAVVVAVVAVRRVRGTIDGDGDGDGDGPEPGPFEAGAGGQAVVRGSRGRFPCASAPGHPRGPPHHQLPVCRGDPAGRVLLAAHRDAARACARFRER